MHEFVHSLPDANDDHGVAVDAIADALPLITISCLYCPRYCEKKSRGIVHEG